MDTFWGEEDGYFYTNEHILKIRDIQASREHNISGQRDRHLNFLV